MSFFAYRQYYPPLSSELSHRPFSPRIKREDEEPILPSTNVVSGSAHHAAHADHRSQHSSDVLQGYRDSFSGADEADANQDVELDGTVRRSAGQLGDRYGKGTAGTSRG